MYTIIGGDGREYGPVSAEQVRQWIASGRANGQTRAKVFGTEEWKALDDFADFAAPPAQPPALGGSEAVATVESTSNLASRGMRLCAFLIDNFIYGICFIPLLLAIPFTALLEAIQTHDSSAMAALPGMLLGAGITGFAFFTLAVIQICLLSVRGQTIGKMIMRVRIVRYEDGAPAGFVRAVLLRAFVMGLFCAVPYLGGFVAITDYCFIFRDDRRCLHDLLARTKVVSVP